MPHKRRYDIIPLQTSSWIHEQDFATLCPFFSQFCQIMSYLYTLVVSDLKQIDTFLSKSHIDYLCMLAILLMISMSISFLNSHFLIDGNLDLFYCCLTTIRTNDYPKKIEKQIYLTLILNYNSCPDAEIFVGQHNDEII